VKYIPLIWSGIWRRGGRTLLIILQTGVAFSLFGALQGMQTGAERAIANSRGDILIVHSRERTASPLLRSQLSQIGSVPGVKAVNLENALVCTYQGPANRVIAVAINADDTFLETLPEFKVLPGQFAAFSHSRTGALVSTGLASKYGWKLGSRIPLVCTTRQSNGSPAWTFDIVGIFSHQGLMALSDLVVINNDYLDEGRLTGRGTVQHFDVVASDPRQAQTVADAIDRRFANSASETRTDSLRELAQAQMQSIGDLGFLIHAVVGAVLFALLTSIATLMMQSIRERVPELAVLRALGFSSATVFSLLLTETLTISVAAAALGLAAASVILPLAGQIAPDFSVPGISMPASVVVLGLALSLLIALLSVALPAYKTSKLEVAKTLPGQKAL